MNQTKMAVKMGVLALAISGVGAVNAADYSGQASATVVTPLSFTVGNTLSFGAFSAPTTALDTLTITTAGVLATTGTQDTQLLTGTGAQQGTFTINGEAGATVAISLGAASVNLVNGANTMPLRPALSASTATLAGGTADIAVGGELDVDVGQAVGTYTGTYTVTVSYN